MWFRNHEGKLINLDRASSIEIVQSTEDRAYVTASEAVGGDAVWEDHRLTDYLPLGEAENLLDRIARALEAQTPDEIGQPGRMETMHKGRSR